MLYRALLVALFGLWVTMWVLHIRSELQPERAGLRTVPVEYVMRNAFRNDKDSDLWINNGSPRAGSLRLSPRTDKDGTRVLTFSGYLTLNLPGGGVQRLGWVGQLEMDKEWSVTRFHLLSTTKEHDPTASRPPPVTELDLTLTPASHRGEYRLSVDKTLADELNFPLDQEGISQLTSHLGFDEAILKQFPTGKPALPVVAARQSTF